MIRAFNYISALIQFRSQMGSRNLVVLLLSILAVKSGFHRGQQSRKLLQEWHFFQQVVRDNKIISAHFSPNECQLTYSENPKTSSPISMALRLPASESSDPLVFEQVFLKGEYQHFLDWWAGACPAASVRQIIDLGANIGCAALYFHSKFPETKIFCIEPEAGNHARLAVNLALNPSGKIKSHQGAIWTNTCRLKCVRDFREGKEWASRFVVNEAMEGGTDDSVFATDIWGLMKLSGFDHVDLFKMDIEGAEATLLQDLEFRRFLMEKTTGVVMEIHPEFISIEKAAAILGSLGFRTQVVDEFLCGYNSGSLK